MNLAKYLTSSAAIAMIVSGVACGTPAFAQDQSAQPSTAPSTSEMPSPNAPPSTSTAPSAGAPSQKQLDIAAARAERKAVVGQNMTLTDDESKVFWPLYDEYEGKMDRIEDRHVREIKEFALHFQNLTNADARKKLNEVMAIAASRLNVQSAYIPKFRAILDDVKVTRFFQIDNKLRALVQCQIAQIVPLAQPAGGSAIPSGGL
jgi:hypothetical protein